MAAGPSPVASDVGICTVRFCDEQFDSMLAFISWMTNQAVLRWVLRWVLKWVLTWISITAVHCTFVSCLSKTHALACCTKLSAAKLPGLQSLQP